MVHENLFDTIDEVFVEHHAGARDVGVGSARPPPVGDDHEFAVLIDDGGCASPRFDNGLKLIKKSRHVLGLCVIVCIYIHVRLYFTLY